MAKKILIIDDDPLILDLFEYSFEKDMFIIIRAENGREGLEKALREKVDLILLDVMMPDLNGYEVCRSIKSNPETSGTKIIMISAKAQKDEIEKGLQAGADEYITKPFDPLLLAAKITALLI
jgi:DNA-binding response OmpR family regulator